MRKEGTKKGGGGGAEQGQGGLRRPWTQKKAGQEERSLGEHMGLWSCFCSGCLVVSSSDECVVFFMKLLY